MRETIDPDGVAIEGSKHEPVGTHFIPEEVETCAFM